MKKIKKTNCLTKNINVPKERINKCAYNVKGISPEIQYTLYKCKEKLQNYYQKNFCGLVLYGSIARRVANDESDIDLLVLLSKDFNYFEEMKKIIDLLYSLQINQDHLISAKPARVDEFNNGKTSFYRAVKSYGKLYT